jgi:BASS family bile acid:Na+ symporter
VGALLAERENIADYIADVGLVASVFCLASLTIGYLLPRLAGVTERQALSSAFEVGIHNSTLAIAVGVSVLGIETLAVPAAVYGVLMFPLALLAGFVIRRWVAPVPAAT